MDDKEFLNYFSLLASQNPLVIKKAANNIATTLLALESKVARKASLDSADHEKHKLKAQEAIRKNYLQGDLGQGMSADLNYSLKRLVRGLTSETHSVKRGFFLAAVLVFKRFRS